MLANDPLLEKGLGYAPSQPDAARKFIEAFHDPDWQRARPPRDQQKTFLPEPTAPLVGLGVVLAGLVQNIVRCYTPQGRGLTVATLDADATINGRILIGKFAEGGTIRLGRNVIINSSFESNPVGGFRTAFVIKGRDAVIEIGNDVGMSNAMIAARERVVIEDGVWIGAGAKIMDTDFHSMHYDERVADINVPTRPVTIKKRAFIGTEAVILKGVTIGEDSVIGACAVVAKSVPAGEIWAGNPAKFIKKLK